MAHLLHRAPKPCSRKLCGRTPTRRRSDVPDVKDPVCGMTIAESDAVATVDHDGSTYYFCSQDCADEFREEPGDYT
ncbi:MAG TPA: hypothetical protein DCS55_08740 [Acidimicrobiaceae bacterium]|nr:hypothetical protein [Acidimicrobiaceae bacterium]